MPDPPLAALRVLRAVAELGSFTAAGRALGYTQSAVSRQVAALESAAGSALFVRHRYGVNLTPAGERLLPRAARALDELDAALRDAPAPTPTSTVRIGAFPVAAAGIVTDALADLARSRPEVVVTMREGTTPSLVRALRHGAIDLAVVAQTPPFRPLDAKAPALILRQIHERELVIAVGAMHPFAGRRSVDVAELADQTWAASRSDDGTALLGVWPGLPGRRDVRYVARDWNTKLALVAAGLAITTVSAGTRTSGDVRLVEVRGGSRELRRLSVARLPGRMSADVHAVSEALAASAGPRLYARDSR
jgi:DNA-binding transcriptional LysR family regulator